MSRIQARKFKPRPLIGAKKTQKIQTNHGIVHSTSPQPKPQAKLKKTNTALIEQTKLPERDSQAKTKLSMKSLKKKHNTPIEITDNNSFLSALKKK